ncbi:MAG: disulfide bond formation protein DsbA [Jatrophihabitantaceae bacterium]|nr:disulfide bond formation protein DsbA [Jatrophihabitantaceae bacterium]
MPRIELDIYSDVICPWCYIGKRKMEIALAQHAESGGPEVAVRWRPFLLNPDYRGPSRPTSEYLAERFGAGAASMAAQVTAVAATVGLSYRMDRSLIADTRAAHQLSDAAFAEGGPAVQGAVTEALLRSHFVEGLDVADHAVLDRIGRDAGLSDRAVDRALQAPESAAEIEHEIAHAGAIGVSAVPTFVVGGRYGVSGAQDPSVLLELLSRGA